MAVESPYFSHDFNSRNDTKMVALRMKEGMEGVGIYWCIVELLYEEGGFAMLLDCERIAFDLRVKVEKVKRVVINYELFRNDGQKFWSESCLKRIDLRNQKSGKARESAIEGWKRRKMDANASPTHSDSNAIKESKEKEKKEKESKVNTAADAELLVWPTFDDFWEAYGKKVDRPKCEKKWIKISQGAREKIMDHVPRYVETTPDVQYRKNPLTYLNNESWNNEIVKVNGRQNSKGADLNSIAEGITRRFNAANGSGQVQ
jgi:hypothetical protein